MLSIGALFVFALLLLVAVFYRHAKKYPPGPFPLPLLGNAHQIVIGQIFGKTIRDLMLEWKKEYGNVITFWLGPSPTVCVLDYDLAVQTYVKNGDAHVGRQNFPLIDEMREGKGIVLSEGDLWLEQRRFALHTLRDFGLGKNIMQDKILKEYHKRMDPFDAELEENGGRLKINPKEKLLELMIGSVINRILVGYSFDESNMGEFLEIRKQLDKSNETLSFVDLVVVRPSLYWIPFVKWRRDEIIKSNDETVAFAKRQIEERERDIADGSYQLDEVAGPQDFLDAFLMERDRRLEESGDIGHYTKEQLVYAIVDLWQAGMETTITTLYWAFLYLLKNEKVQEKMREEIWSVVGKDRDVELADRQLLPYCNGALNEVHRLTSLLTLNVMRRSVRESVVGDFTIPAGTDNAVVMAVIFNDGDVFSDPAQFRPERYLGDDGKTMEQKVIPFGLGKRACLGEGLARAEMYLVLLNIIKNYRIVDDGGIRKDWEEGKMTAFIRLPHSYKCIFEKAK
ncbi:hypothetical protein QR680_006039 [Steinernema hermaphroditum]|uniref:Unspecific monooxygenase n=1 Tax=Steinernema hermaphroditum TaxID=289476 RepID=A0AA39HU24_9BILA|nr:hypothetical protein QR680_006039 [Steinernema hermaphroditum]